MNEGLSVLRRRKRTFVEMEENVMESHEEELIRRRPALCCR